jgi:hypothetical protein
MVDAYNLLQEYHFDILKDMVELLGVSPASNKKVAHINALSSFLFTPQAVEKGLSQLSRRERETLTILQRAGGQVEANRLRLQLLRQNVVEPPEASKRRTYPSLSGIVFAPEERRMSFVAVVGRLMATGLVCGKGVTYSHYANRTKIYYDNVHSLFIPDPVRKLLPAPSPLLTPEVSVERLTHTTEGSARAFQRDIYFYWSTAHTTPLSLTKEGRLYKRDLRLVNSALLQPEDIAQKDEPDYPRLIFMRLLLTDLGVLRRDANVVHGIDHPPFLGSKPTDRIRHTFTHWRDGTFWNELLSVPKITILNADSRIDPAPRQISRARQRVLEHVAELHRAGATPASTLPQEERWVAIAQLIDSLRMADYDFLFPRNYSPSSTYYHTRYAYEYTSVRSPYISYGNAMGWSISPRFEDEAEGWEVIEAGFIRAMLVEPLHWMGLVDIGYAGERPVAYRLTPVGEWVLGVGSEVTIPEAEGKVIVQPNFEMFALDPISDLTLAKLDEFADRITAERAIKYQITRESVYRAQQNRWTSSRIIDTLNDMSDTPLPQNVSRTLIEWQTIHERIKIHRHGALLQAADGTLLDRLMQDPRVSASFAARPDDTVALIVPRQGETEELVRNLQTVGYPPARTRSASQKPRPSVAIGDVGELRFTIDLPSIYLFEQIAPFTGQDEQGRYFLTQSAVQEAISGGMTVEDILGRLRALHLGPLPRWVEIRVRAWGHYYGDVAVQTITLVQIKDEKTLHELLAEPELEGILRPFALNGDKALAVATSDLDALRRAFAERNINVQDQLD